MASVSASVPSSVSKSGEVRLDGELTEDAATEAGGGVNVHIVDAVHDPLDVPITSTTITTDLLAGD